MATKPLIEVAEPHPYALSRPTARIQWQMTASLIATDLTILMVIFGISVLGRHYITPRYELGSNFEMIPCMLLLLAAFGAKGLYPGVLLHPAEEMRRIFVCVSTVFLLMAATTFMWHSAQAYSRSIFLVSWGAGTPLLLLARHFTRLTLSKCSWWGVPAIVFGSGPLAKRVIRRLGSGRMGIRIDGIVSDGDEDSAWPTGLPPILGDIAEGTTPGVCQSAHYAIIALPHRQNNELRQVIQDHCRGFGHILLIPDMPGLCSLGISARDLGGEVGFELPQRLFHIHSALAKRALDITMGLIAFAVLLPLFLSVALCVMSTSPGPIFYSQKRYGWKGQTFRALKFRTMLENGDEVLRDHLHKNPKLLEEWQSDRKLKADPRVTRVGKWLRRLSLDELPQIINVLVGDMSLVGPRPLPLGDLAKYGKSFDLYARVRPGMTGLWQVSGRNNTTYEERIAFDEYYIRNWSIWLDTYIMVRTVKAVCTAEGAY